MTLDEARKLKEGDHVEALIGRRWRLCLVERGSYEDGLIIAGRPCYLYVRRVGKTSAGRRFPQATVWLNDVRTTEYRPEPANVYADFLEDAGHHEAAAALRKAFPMGDAS